MTAFRLDSIHTLPKASLADVAARTLDQLQQYWPEDAAKAEPAKLSSIIDAMAGNSEFLAMLIHRHPATFARLYHEGPEACYEHFMAELALIQTDQVGEDALMRQLRQLRAQIALTIAFADIMQLWDTPRVTASLSAFADEVVRIAATYLLQRDAARGQVQLDDAEHPISHSGLVILALGKLGAQELNYSSDIDLMILFDPERVSYIGRHSPQHYFTRFANQLAQLLQQRTKDGYVFRVDLRLRPDPRSTPPAVSVESAISYYESLGQNWERAAMIKARPVIADAPVYARFEQCMQNYIWRKHLDFASIRDIDAIKRQVNAKAGEAIQTAGYHVKLGRGGIREIEFFNQTKQLVWGGRYHELRVYGTNATLQALEDTKLISTEIHHTLKDAYWFFRRVEHHLQMLHDQQTHSIPEKPDDIAHLARFLGFDCAETFESTLLAYCQQVHQIYIDSIETNEPLSIDGNLVFTGVEPDPETLKTLSKLGFSAPAIVWETIQSWHHGTRRATRSYTARQLLTELTPALLESLSYTPNPQHAFIRFDSFISQLPAGVQIFALLDANPKLLELVITLLGVAPALGELLAKHPSLLDIVLQEDFYGKLASKETLHAELAEMLSHEDHEEGSLRALRRFRQEKEFQAGVQILKHQCPVAEANRFLSNLAEVILPQTLQLAHAQLARKHGEIPGSRWVILALGKLGTGELSFGSDLDLIFLYDCPDNQQSTGEREVDAHRYFQRLASRFVNDCQLLTKEGLLYALDLRLRPGGSQAGLATHLSRFAEYQQRDGWMIEALALTKARILFASDASIQRETEQIIHQALERSFASKLLKSHILSVRTKIQQHYGRTTRWDVKYHPGGITDLDFLAQYFVSQFQDRTCIIPPVQSDHLFALAGEHQIITDNAAKALQHAYRLQHDVLVLLRLCSPQALAEDHAPQSMKRLITELLGVNHWSDLKLQLQQAQEQTIALWHKHLSA